MAVLDDLSGFEFEDVMEDVFRNLGYENVHQAAKTADEGRDVLMEEVVDGSRRGVVVECKHTDAVGRPVVQKLHSAIATYGYDGPKRGIVVTTGRFTDPAREYAERLDRGDDPYPIELIDGEALRRIAEEVGLDLYNGRIEILCEETLRPFDPAAELDAPVREAFRDIENVGGADLPAPTTRATFEPVVVVTADVDATFETTVGVVHRVDASDTFVVHAGRGRPGVLDGEAARLVVDNLDRTVDLGADAFAEQFDERTVSRFGRTETEYKEWAVDRACDRHTTTVSYTGDNNVTYTKTCEPAQSDVTVRSVTPVYLPAIRQTTTLGTYSYPYEYYAAGPSRVTREDGIHRCVHCEGAASMLTHCANCGSINCPSHTKTERLEGTPVCTGCAVTERFAFRTKYFYDAANREAFRESYDAMGPHEKAMENKPLAAGVGVSALVLIAFALVALGLV